MAELLASAPMLKIIVTSRTALHLQGEHLYPVPQLSASSAVDLFVARAKAIKPAFTIRSEEDRIIGEICKRLDYLPLSNRVGVSRVRMFEPAQLLTRLSTRLDVLTDGARDLPPRQRTLRNTIAWSYNLLSRKSRRCFGDSASSPVAAHWRQQSRSPVRVAALGAGLAAVAGRQEPGQDRDSRR